MSQEVIKLSVANIKNDLADGVTRLKSDKNYHVDKGSIEEKYSLTPAEVGHLFKEPLLKGIRTVPYTPKRWVLVEEEEEVNTLSAPEATTQEPVQEVEQENVVEELPLGEELGNETVQESTDENLF